MNNILKYISLGYIPQKYIKQDSYVHPLCSAMLLSYLKILQIIQKVAEDSGEFLLYKNILPLPFYLLDYAYLS